MQHGKQNAKRIWRRGLDGVSGQSETLELVSGLVGKKKQAGRVSQSLAGTRRRSEAQREENVVNRGRSKIQELEKMLGEPGLSTTIVDGQSGKEWA